MTSSPDRLADSVSNCHIDVVDTHRDVTSAFSNAAGSLTDDDDLDEAQLRREPADLDVRLMAVRAELEHLPQHRNSPAGTDRRDGTQGSCHRLGVGVVGVVDHDNTVGAYMVLHPHRRSSAGRRQPLDRRREIDAEHDRRRDRSRGVPCVVRADQWDVRLDAPSIVRQREARAAVGIDVEPADPYVPGLAERHDRRLGAGGHRGDEQVIGVEHDDAVTLDRLGELALGLGDDLGRAELTNVGVPTLSTTPMSGGAIRHSSAMSPWARAPISTTR